MSAIMLHVQFHVVIKPLSLVLYKDDRASCLNKTRLPCGHEAISSNSMRNKNVACNCIYCHGIHSVVRLFSDRKCTLIQIYYVLVYNEEQDKSSNQMKSIRTDSVSITSFWVQNDTFTCNPSNIVVMIQVHCNLVIQNRHCINCLIFNAEQ